MIGVLIVGGIIGYAMMYSGISALGVVPSIGRVTTLGALWPKGPLGAKPYTPPKPTDSVGVGGAHTGATGIPRTGGRT